MIVERVMCIFYKSNVAAGKETVFPAKKTAIQPAENKKESKDSNNACENRNVKRNN